jgi:alkanesulfonate monooxygenase SsuD/methylene tetrahydromethanopterin reductase-like flavin-dependent oxidoreductase (luciferase family)
MGVAGFAPELGVLDALSLAVAPGPLTERIRLGRMVSPVTMRHPVMLALRAGRREALRRRGIGGPGIHSIVI